MEWSNEQIADHLVAAKLLVEIKDKVILLIKSNLRISEFEVQKFISDQYKAKGLTTSIDRSIVAFRENTSFVHYYPQEFNCKKLEKETLIMLDIWARLDKSDAPFADITWMAYYGGRPDSEIVNHFDIVMKARDACLDFIEESLDRGVLPVGMEADKACRDVIELRGLGKNFPHTTGHSLGLSDPHGEGDGLSPRNKKRLEKNLGYTIEPGIYMEGGSGFRSEIDFYIDEKNKLIITTEVQDKITII